MKLVDNWKQAWRWWSVRLAAVGATGAGLIIAAPEAMLHVWAMLPAELQVGLAEYRTQIALAVFVVAVIARLIKQDTK